ncbi:MAG: hypothetical protein AVDCRST_MAG39-1778 [uncultured Sphingomonadaceae bacterium]|uniref:DUF2383 domain-containing protein n=1 Tax=uncultured Sphingomonadaceae bacterium TaxID=169976 RepID=A0A6J4SX15_9SPHN|nr:MAG: hypothetical protein AVDCRST_MAG39-1778 [uncultured Sphingomonadaceae bacterium]
MASNHDISVLNGLIETTLDSVDGYRRSASEASAGQFAAMFSERANERQQVVQQLQQEVRRLGGTPEDDGSVLAAAHRTFLSIRDSLTGKGDDSQVIAEVERGEDFLRNKWETALADAELGQETRQLITQAYESVRRGAEQARALNQGMSGSSSMGSSSL